MYTYKAKQEIKPTKLNASGRLRMTPTPNDFESFWLRTTSDHSIRLRMTPDEFGLLQMTLDVFDWVRMTPTQDNSERLRLRVKMRCFISQLIIYYL